jgi:hypothetical protein
MYVAQKEHTDRLTNTQQLKHAGGINLITQLKHIDNTTS